MWNRRRKGRRLTGRVDSAKRVAMHQRSFASSVLRIKATKNLIISNKLSARISTRASVRIGSGGGSKRGMEQTFVDGVDPTKPISLVEIIVIVPVNIFR